MKEYMNERLKRITDEAIHFIRNAEKLALRMDERGFHVAFSGGKDSQVLLALVEMANVKHHAEMQVTSVDSSNLMRFVRKYYPQVKLNLPKRNMRQLILDKCMLPTRQARFCCRELKEQAGAGCCTCIGIRKAESSNRAKRHSVEVIGQRVGYDIVDGELHEQNNWGGNYSTTNDRQMCTVLAEKTKLLFLLFLNGQTMTFGHSYINTIFHIVTFTIRDFIVLVVCSALWLHQRKRQGKCNCSLNSPKGFIFGLFVN